MKYPVVLTSMVVLREWHFNDIYLYISTYISKEWQYPFSLYGEYTIELELELGVYNYYPSVCSKSEMTRKFDEIGLNIAKYISEEQTKYKFETVMCVTLVYVT